MTTLDPDHDADAAERSAAASPTPPGTQTLIRGLRVLEAMAGQARPIGVGDLSRQLDMPKSTVQRLLKTLAQEGWAQTSSEPTTRWQLSPRLAALSSGDSLANGLRGAALPHLTALGAQTQETIHFVVPDRDVQLVLIDRVDSTHPIRSFNDLGATTGFHTSAGGKAFMAALPDDELQRFLDRPLEKVMPNTITDPQQLLHQVLEARRNGYAVNISENREHVCAIGAAVVNRAGRPVACVVISMPDIRFEPSLVSEWGEWVRDTARAIGRNLPH